jgi:hypothetical protein
VKRKDGEKVGDGDGVGGVGGGSGAKGGEVEEMGMKDGAATNERVGAAGDDGTTGDGTAGNGSGGKGDEVEG